MGTVGTGDWGLGLGLDNWGLQALFNCQVIEGLSISTTSLDYFHNLFDVLFLRAVQVITASNHLVFHCTLKLLSYSEQLSKLSCVHQKRFKVGNYV